MSGERESSLADPHGGPAATDWNKDLNSKEPMARTLIPASNKGLSR